MDYVVVALLAIVVGVFMWEYFKRNMPFWQMRMEQIRNPEPDEKSWSVHPKTEFTVSRNGKTRTYSSLEEMPAADRKCFEDAKQQIEEARKLARDLPGNPFFDEKNFPGAFRSTTTTVTTKTSRVETKSKPQPTQAPKPAPAPKPKPKVWN